MQTGRSRRSRPPTGMTNLARSGSSTIVGMGPSATTAGGGSLLASSASQPYVNPLIATSPKKNPYRPYTADSSVASTSRFQRTMFSHFLEAGDPAKSRTEGVHTRTQLLEKRRHSRQHFFDRYDLNGDGVVDPFEVRLGALVDLNGDGEISQDEKDHLRDLIEQGKLKNLDLLRDKSGGDAKRALTWVGSKEDRRVQRQKEIERRERLERIKRAREAGKNATATVSQVGGEDLPSSTSMLLNRLARALGPDPTLDLATVLKPRIHDGSEPMARVMTGRHTPSLEYKTEPRFKSRSEMMAHRASKRRFDASYDLDGDGQVDPIEHMVASLLDVNKDGKLSEEELRHASALVERLREHYVTGLAGSGPSAPGVRIVQRGGKVYDGVVERSAPSDMRAMMSAPDSRPSTGDTDGSGEGTQVPALAETRRHPDSDLIPPSRADMPPSSPVVTSPAGSARHSSIWSPSNRDARPALSTGRSRILSRAGTSASRPGTGMSLAEEFRRDRGAAAPSPLVRKVGQAEVMRVPQGGSSARPSTGMSRLLGV